MDTVVELRKVALIRNMIKNVGKENDKDENHECKTNTHTQHVSNKEENKEHYEVKESVNHENKDTMEDLFLDKCLSNPFGPSQFAEFEPDDYFGKGEVSYSPYSLNSPNFLPSPSSMINYFSPPQLLCRL